MSETQSEKAQEVLSKPAADTKPEASLQVDAEMEEEQREQVRQVVTSVQTEYYQWLKIRQNIVRVWKRK